MEQLPRSLEIAAPSRASSSSTLPRIYMARQRLPALRHTALLTLKHSQDPACPRCRLLSRPRHTFRPVVPFLTVGAVPTPQVSWLGTQLYDCSSSETISLSERCSGSRNFRLVRPSRSRTDFEARRPRSHARILAIFLRATCDRYLHASRATTGLNPAAQSAKLVSLLDLLKPTAMLPFLLSPPPNHIGYRVNSGRGTHRPARLLGAAWRLADWRIRDRARFWRRSLTQSRHGERQNSNRHKLLEFGRDKRLHKQAAACLDRSRSRPRQAGLVSSGQSPACPDRQRKG